MITAKIHKVFIASATGKWDTNKVIFENENFSWLKKNLLLIKMQQQNKHQFMDMKNVYNYQTIPTAEQRYSRWVAIEK